MFFTVVLQSFRNLISQKSSQTQSKILANTFFDSLAILKFFFNSVIFFHTKIPGSFPIPITVSELWEWTCLFSSHNSLWEVTSLFSIIISTCVSETQNCVQNIVQFCIKQVQNLLPRGPVLQTCPKSLASIQYQHTIAFFDISSPLSTPMILL